MLGQSLEEQFLVGAFYKEMSSTIKVTSFFFFLEIH